MMSISGAWGDPRLKTGEEEGKRREAERKKRMKAGREPGSGPRAQLEQGGASQGSGCCQGRTPSTDGGEFGEFEGTMLEEAEGVLVLQFLLRVRRQGR